MFKTVKDALEEKEWEKIPIQVYFYWNKNKLENSGQVHIRSSKRIGFFDGEIVNILVSGTKILIISTGKMRDSKKRANENSRWRVLTQGNLAKQDYYFKYRQLFTLFNFQSPSTFKGKKVRVSDYIPNENPNNFAILVDVSSVQTTT